MRKLSSKNVASNLDVEQNKTAMRRKRSLLRNRRMFFEALEERRVLATVTWDGEAGDGLWTTPANWSTNVVPAGGDDVVIDVGASTQVKLRGDVPPINSLTNRSTLFLEGLNDTGFARLTIDGPSSNFGTIIMAATTNDGADRSSLINMRNGATLTNEATGSIQVGDGDGGVLVGRFLNQGNINVLADVPLVVNGIYTQSGGSISTIGIGQFIQTGGSFTLSGGSANGIVRLTNTTINITGSSAASLVRAVGNNVLLNNLAPQVTLWIEGTTQYGYSQIFVDQDATNLGTIRMEASSSDGADQNSYITPRNGATFTNGPTGTLAVNVGAGDGQVIFGRFANSGQIAIEAGAELVQSSGEFRFNGGSVQGRFRLQTSKIDVAATVTSPSVLNVTGDNNVLGSNESSTVTLRLEGSNNTGFSRIYVDQDATNRGTILMEASSNDGADRSSYLSTRGAAKFTNATTGRILVGIGDGGSLIGNIINEGLLSVIDGHRLFLNGNFTQAGGSITVQGAGEFLQTSGSLLMTGGTTQGIVRFTNTLIAIASTATTPTVLRVIGDNNVLHSNLSSAVTLWLEGMTAYAFSRIYIDQDTSNFGTIRMESSSDDGGNQNSYIMTRNGAKLTNEFSGLIEARAGAGDDRLIYGNLINKGTLQATDGELLQLVNVDFTQAAGSIATAGSGEVLLNQGQYYMTGGQVTGNFRIFASLIDVAATVTQATTLRIVGDNNFLGSSLSPSTTLWLNGNAAYGYSRMYVDQDKSNHGTIRMESSFDDGGNQASYLHMRNGARLTNTASGVIDLVPGAGDARYIDGGLVNNGLVRVRSGQSANSFSGTLINSGSIQVETNAQFTLNSASVTQLSGTISATGNSSVLVDNGSFVFTGGSLEGIVRVRNTTINVAATVSSNSTLRVVGDNSILNGNLSPNVTLWLEGNTLYGYSRFYVDQNASNFGKIRMESTSDDGGNQASYIMTRNGAVFSNEPGGLIEARSGAGDDRFIYGQLVNKGTLSAGAGELLNLFNLNLSQSAGAITTEGTGEVLLNQGHILLAGGDLSGNLKVFNSLVDISASVSQPTTLRLIGSENTLGSSLSSAATIWLDGNTSNGYSRIYVDQDKTNFGKIRMESSSDDGGNQGSYLSIRNGARLTNSPSGTIDLNLGAGDARYISGIVTNDGNIRVQSGMTSTSFSGALVNNATITVEPNAQFSLSSTALSQTAGSINTSGGSSVFQDAGTFHFTGGQIDGVVRVRNTAINVASSVTSTSTLRVVGDNSVLGSFDAPSVTLWLEGSTTYGYSRFFIDQNVTNFGTIRMESTSDDGGNQASYIHSRNGAKFTNATSGLIDIRAGAGDERYFITDVINEGTLRTNTNVSFFSGEIRNKGILSASSGVLNFSTSSLVNENFALISSRQPINVSGTTIQNLGTLDESGAIISSLEIFPSVVQLGFSSALGMNPATVTTAANYSLVRSGGDGIFGNANDVDLSSNISQVVFDSASQLASLILSSTLVNDLYLVTVNAPQLSTFDGITLFPSLIPIAHGLGAATPAVELDLQSASDTGFSTTDNLTKDNTPTFDALVKTTGSVAFDFNDDGTIDQTLTVTVPGVYQVTAPNLADGLNTVRAVLTPTVGLPVQSKLDVQIDTAKPSHINVFAIETAPSTVRLIKFSEPLDGTNLAAMIASLTMTGPGNISIPVGNVRLLNDTIEVTYPAQTAPGQYRISIAAPLPDFASNAPTSPFEDTFTLRSTAQWIGGSGDWFNPSNWQGGRVPTADHDVVINVAGGDPNVVIAINGIVTVRSLNANNSITLAPGASLKLTSGNSQVLGRLNALHASMVAEGSGTQFVASGFTSIDASSVAVAAGGRISLPKLTSYRHSSTGGNQYRYFSSSGAGSVLDLGNLQSITNGTDGAARVFISATAGGMIDLHSVTTIRDGQGGDYSWRLVDVTADGTGSLINLNSLTTFVDDWANSDYGGASFSSLQSSNNASILVSSLQSVTGLALNLANGVTVGLPSLISAINSQFNVTSGTWNFPLLTDITGSAVTFSGGSLTMDQVNKADRASFVVSGGRTFALPSLVTYRHASTGGNQYRYFSASGAGSVLDLGNLQSITNGTDGAARVFISATAGGMIDLHSVTTIRDGQGGDYSWRLVDVTADGTGSLINLNSLTTFVDDWANSDYGGASFSSLQSSNNASILVSSLQSVTGLALNLANGVTVGLPSLVSAINSQFNVTSGTWNFPLLTDITGSAVTFSGGSLTMDQVNKADRASFVVSGGRTFALPSLVTYRHASTGGNQYRYFSASGAGSVLDLGNLQSITNGTDGAARVFISATAGGMIDLHSVTTIRDGQGGDYSWRLVDVTADGTGSLINLNSLTTFVDDWANSDYGGASFSSLQSSNNASILVSTLQSVTGLALNLANGVTVGLPSLVSAINSQFNVTSGTWNFPLLTDITGSAVTFSGGSLTMDQVNKADRASFVVSGGRTFALPSLVTYRHASTGGNQYRYFSASGAGSVLDLGNLQSITNGTDGAARVFISATAGGMIDLHSVTTIRDGQGGDYSWRLVDVTADGTGSLINLNSLTTFVDDWANSDYGGASFSSLQSSNNASILVSSLQSVTGLALNLANGVTVGLPSLVSAINSQFNVTSGTWNFPLLTDITGSAVTFSGGSLTMDQVNKADRASFVVSGGRTFALPSLVTYRHASTGGNQYRYFSASGAGSVLDLGNLQSITNGTDGAARVFISATAGGMIDLHSVTTIRDGQGGDYSWRLVDVTADGTGSLINLNSLTTFVDDWANSDYGGASFSSLQSSNNASILVSTLQSVTGLALNLANGVTVGLPSLVSAINSQFNVTSGTWNFPLLTDITGSAVTFSGGSLTMDQVNKADRASFVVSGGRTFALPSLVTYRHASTGGNQYRYFSASGAGSVLDLGNLQSITNGTDGAARVFISATAGGMIDLHSVTTIRDGQGGDYSWRLVDVTADGTGSLINLNSLTTFVDDWANSEYGGASLSSLQSSNMGEIALGLSLAIHGVSFALNSQLTTVSNLQLLANSLLTGTGTFAGNVLNTAGAVKPGNGAGRLSISGNYTQQSTGSMVVDITGNIAGGTYDQLVVSGRVTLDGALIINRASNFSPSLGSTFDIVTAGNGREGQFSSLSGIALPGNRELSTNYLTNGVTLVTDPSVGPFVSGLAPASPLAAPATSIDVLFSKPIDPATFTRGDVTLTGPDGLVIVDSLLRLSDSAYRINFQPQFTGTFTLTVGPNIADFVGNVMDQNRNGTSGEANDAFVGQFQLIPDTIAPTVAAVTPRGLRNAPFSSFQVDFSEPIDPTSFTPADVTIIGPNGAIASGSITVTPVSSLNRSFTVSFPEQSANFAYNITLNRDIRDRSANQLPANYVFSIVVDTIGPRVQSVSDSGTINAPINAIDVTFDERINSFTAAHITLVGPDGTVATGNPFLIGNQQYRIPFNTLRTNGLYTLTIGPGVTDLAGNNMTVGGGGAYTSTFTISLSDLTIAANGVQLSTATSLFGNSIDVNWTTRNLGTLKSPSVWSDRIWLSTDAILDANDRLLTTSSTNLASGIDPAGTSPFSQNVTLPLESGLIAGNYFVLVQLDSNSNVEEANEANNIQSAPITLSYPALPDLVAPSASMVGPTSIASGSRFNFTWAIENTGTANAVGPWLERVYVASSTSGTDRQLLGEFTHTGTLTPADAPLVRNQFFDMPNFGLAGSLYFMVEVDSNASVFETNESNLFASSMQTNVPFVLAIEFNSANVSEGGGAIEATLTRNGAVTAPLTVTITVNPTGQLTIPAQVVIPAGQYTTRFNISALEDSVVEGDQTIQVTLDATGFAGTTVPLNIVDNDRATLSLAIAPGSIQEGGTATATLTRSVATASELVVALDANRSQFNLPLTVTIPANQTSITFDLTAIDDTLIEAATAYTVTASASGLNSGTATVAVAENDVPTLQITLPTGSLPEGSSGPTVRGTVTRSVVSDRDVVVTLLSSDPTQLILPATVIIPAGRPDAKFDITVLDDGLVNGSRSVNLTARVQTTDSTQTLNTGAATQPLTILDNDGPTLTLMTDRSIVAEGGTARLTITRNTATTNAFEVQLLSSDTTELQVPATVTIPAGSASIQIIVSGIIDSIADGDQTVTITGSSAGFSSGVNALIVSDLDLPDLLIESIQTPVVAETGDTVNISWTMANVGYSSALNVWTQRVYLSNNSQIGDDTLAGQFTFTGPLPAGGSYDRTAPIRMPTVPGQYWVVVEVDVSDSVREGFEGNNARISTFPITVLPSYTATVSTNVEMAPADTVVPLIGTALKTNGSPAAFEQVSIHLQVRGTTRVLTAITDASGNFATSFKPLPGEGGIYTIGASHPGLTSAPVQDTFQLVGMRAEPAASDLRIIEGNSVNGQIVLTNLSEIALTGLSIQVVDAPSNLSITTSLLNNATSVPASGRVTLQYSVTANNSSTLSAPVRLRVVSDQSSSGIASAAIATLNVTVVPLTARLESSPAGLAASMLVGGQTFVDFTLTNSGGRETGPLTLLLPTGANWLTSVSPTAITSIGPGSSTKLTLALTPTASLALTMYNGNLIVRGDDSELSVPFSFRAVSSSKGNLEITVLDEYFYFTQEKPFVDTAVVILKDIFTGAEIARSTPNPGGGSGEGEDPPLVSVDAQGRVTFTGVNAGNYTLEIQSSTHEPYSKPVSVVAGELNAKRVFVPRNFVQYKWKVEETEIEDRTKIKIESVFETNVPAPVVTVEGQIDLADITVLGQTKQFNLKITNHGLISANDVALNFGSHPHFRITPLIDVIGVLTAKSEIIVPVTVTRIAEAGGGSSGGGEGEGPALPCTITAYIVWWYYCDGKVYRSTPILILNATTTCGIGSVTGGGSYFGDYSSAPGLTPVVIESKPVDCLECTPNAWTLTINEDGLLNDLISVGTDMLELSPPIESIEFTLEGTASWEDCCEDGKKVGSKLTAQGSGTATAALKMPLIGGDFRDLVDDIPLPFPGGAEFDISMAAGVFLVGEVSGKVFGNVTTDCLDWTKVNGCAGIELSGSFGISAILSLEVEVEINNVDYAFVIEVQGGVRANALAMAKICIKDGVTTYDWSVTAGPIELFGNATITIPEQLADRLNVDAEQVNWEIGTRTILDACTWSKDNPAGTCGGASGEDPQNPLTGQPFDISVGRIIDLNQLAVNVGFNNTAEMANSLNLPSADLSTIPTSRWQNVFEDIRTIKNPDSLEGGSCAHVRIEIEQDVVQTRQAFNASLEIDNALEHSLQGIGIDIVVRDVTGRNVTDLFAIFNPVLVNMTGVTGFGVLNAKSVGSATWTIVPTLDAARSGATQYFVSGQLRYSDGGIDLTVPLAPTSITVLPQPELYLNYFLQRDVLGDDPFTEVTEDSVPFTLAVQIHNQGAGVAKKLRIESAQPKITENEKGLLIDFEIIGTSVNGAPADRSLTAQIGDIAPGQLAFAEWQMLSSLQGLFVEYKATFEHLSGLGDERLSLIKAVNIRELIRTVDSRQSGLVDLLPDFLVNDLPDPVDLPDTLYLSDGSRTQVQLGVNASFDAPPRLDDLRVGVTATMPAGWSYLKMDDPSAGGFDLVGVQRSDGTMLPLKNFWQTDRTFIGGGKRPILENKIHLLDFNSTGQYNFIFSNGDVVGPSVLEVTGVPTAVLAPVDSADVKFSELLDSASFDRADLQLRKNGQPVTLGAAVQVTQLANENYRITGLSGFTGDDAVYELTITATSLTDQVGNAGLGSKTLTWVKGQAAPAVVDVLGLPSGLSNVAPSVIDVQFTEPIVLTSFTAEDITLSRGGTNLDLSAATFSQINDTTYRIGSISSLLATDGPYSFSINATGIQDVDSGNSGIGGRTVTWTLDRTAPQVLDVVDITTDPRNIVVQRIDVEFSEPIDLTTLDTSDLVLTRTGSTTNLLANENRLSFAHLIGNVYRISGINWVQGFIATPQIAEFNFTISGSGIQDVAGNSGQGSASESWIIDLDRPVAVSNLVLSTAQGPVVGGQVPSMAANIAGTVSEVGLTVAIRDMTTDTELARKTLTGTDFQLPIIFPTAGQHQLRVRLIDRAGNTTDTLLNDLFVFDTPPVIESLTGLPAAFARQAVDAFVVKFVTPVNPGSVQRTSFRLTRNGGANLIDNTVVVTPQADGRSFRVSGLAGITVINGRYDLTVDLSTILSTTGIVGSGNLAKDWKMDSVAPSSTLVPLATTQPLATFAISLTGTDPAISPIIPGSGVSAYEVFVSIDNGPFDFWQTIPADQATAEFTGLPNRSYAFRSFALDAAGNRETKTTTDTSTFVPDLIAPVTTVDSVDKTHSRMKITFSGTDVGNNLRFFDVFVSVDGGAPQTIGRVQAGPANASGVYSGTIEYQAIADGLEHRYRIFTSGIDVANNIEETPGEDKGVTVTATYLTATNVGSLEGDVLTPLSVTGTWSNPRSGNLTLVASRGTIVKNDNGTWTWSLLPSARIQNELVTITANDGTIITTAAFNLTARVNIPNQKVYYRESSFSQSGNNVNAALDNSKVLARSGTNPQTLSYANLINTTRGINGMVLDVAGLVASNLTATDFVFRMSPTGLFNEATNPPSGWATAPAPTGIFVTPGTATTPSRVRLEWANNAIENRWLQLQVIANANTGLPSTAVYYFGHLQGEVNGQVLGGAFFVTTQDQSAVLPLGLANVSNPRDMDKNGFVTTQDLTAVRNSINAGRTLRVITIPVAGSLNEGAATGGQNLVAGSLFAADGSSDLIAEGEANLAFPMDLKTGLGIINGGSGVTVAGNHQVDLPSDDRLNTLKNLSLPSATDSVPHCGPAVDSTANASSKSSAPATKQRKVDRLQLVDAIMAEFSLEDDLT